MPVYLLHGFRWPRESIRIHIILQDLDDAAAEWLVAPGTTACMLDNFCEIYPDAMDHLPNLRFIEQHDPNDFSESSVSQPYAYVADIVHEIKLGVDLQEVTTASPIPARQWDALSEIRDKLAPDTKLGWFVVVCGDEDRFAGAVLDEGYNKPSVTTMPIRVRAPPRTAPSMSGYHNYDDSRGPGTAGSSFASTSTSKKDFSSPDMSRKSFGSPDTSRRGYSSPDLPPKGFKKLLGSLTRRKSRACMRDGSAPTPTNGSHRDPQVPPLPQSRVVT